MKILSYSIISVMLVLAAGCTNVERSRSLGNVNVSGQTIAQQVCSTCHGTDGNSKSPEYPKLAGQQPEYLVAQLQNFNQHARTDRLALEMMAGMSRNLTQDQVSQIAVYFYHQKSVNETANHASFSEGKSIYQNGLSAKGIVPCMACHGPNAEGNGIFPRLAGQHKQYLIKQLLVFRDTHGRPGTPMGDISKSITDSELEPLADYLSSLN